MTADRTLGVPITANRLPVYALMGANAVSLVGNQLSSLAIPWFVLVTTGSATKTGLVAFCTILPTVIAALLGGALVDRLGAKRMSVVADLLSGITVAVIPLLYATVGLAFWQLLVLVFLGALLDAPGDTARSALFPDLATAAGLRLERANASYQAVQRFSQLLGPPLAGILIAWIGTTNVLWLDAATFAVSAVAVAAVIPNLTVARDGASRYRDEVREGWDFLRHDRLLRALVATVALTNLLDAALSAVVMPVYVERRFGDARDLGYIRAGFGAAAFASSLLFGAIGHRLPRRGAYVGAFILAAVPLWALVPLPPLAVAIASRIVTGIGAGPLNPILSTIFQERVPPELRGRVFGATTAAVLVAAPGGVLLAGYALEAFGLRTVLAVIAAVYLLVTMSMLLAPSLRDMGPRPAPTGGGMDPTS